MTESRSHRSRRRLHPRKPNAEARHRLHVQQARHLRLEDTLRQTQADLDDAAHSLNSQPRQALTEVLPMTLEPTAVTCESWISSCRPSDCEGCHASSSLVRVVVFASAVSGTRIVGRRGTVWLEKPPDERSKLPALFGVERAGNETLEFFSKGFRSRCEFAFPGRRQHYP